MGDMAGLKMSAKKRVIIQYQHQHRTLKKGIILRETDTVESLKGLIKEEIYPQVEVRLK